MGQIQAHQLQIATWMGLQISETNVHFIPPSLWQEFVAVMHLIWTQMVMVCLIVLTSVQRMQAKQARVSVDVEPLMQMPMQTECPIVMMSAPLFVTMPIRRTTMLMLIASVVVPVLVMMMITTLASMLLINAQEMLTRQVLECVDVVILNLIVIAMVPRTVLTNVRLMHIRLGRASVVAEHQMSIPMVIANPTAMTLAHL
jgi:hypothetical protein